MSTSITLLEISNTKRECMEIDARQKQKGYPCPDNNHRVDHADCNGIWIYFYTT